ncbi:hypothetical protein Gotur_009339, partial [Gossypium turneri]
MIDREKHKLSTELESLLGELPENIVDFRKEQSSSDGQIGEDEIEINIDALSHETLYKLHIVGSSYPLVAIEKGLTYRNSKCSSFSGSSGESGSSFRGLYNYTIDNLLKSYYKTASLIATSTKGAVIFSGADHSVTEQMYEYEKNLGLSFQVVDDILDFTQSTEQLGKPASSDQAKGNLTAPVIFALKKEPKLRDIIESEFCETGSLNEAIKLVKQCGGIERAQ